MEARTVTEAICKSCGQIVSPFNPHYCRGLQPRPRKSDMDGLVEKVREVTLESSGFILLEHEARAAIEAVFDALAEPSGDAITLGAEIIYADGNPDAVDWYCSAEDAFKAMLATLRKQALG